MYEQGREGTYIRLTPYGQIQQWKFATDYGWQVAAGGGGGAGPGIGTQPGADPQKQAAAPGGGGHQRRDAVTS